MTVNPLARRDRGVTIDSACEAPETSADMVFDNTWTVLRDVAATHVRVGDVIEMMDNPHIVKHVSDADDILGRTKRIRVAWSHSYGIEHVVLEMDKGRRVTMWRKKETNNGV